MPTDVGDWVVPADVIGCELELLATVVGAVVAWFVLPVEDGGVGDGVVPPVVGLGDGEDDDGCGGGP